MLHVFTNCGKISPGAAENDAGGREGVRYVYEYSFLSMFFLAAVMANFFSRRQFPNFRNRLFAAGLVCAFVNIFLDVLSALAIQYSKILPAPAVCAACMGFYIMQAVFPALIAVYVAACAGRLRAWSPALRSALMAPAAVVALMVLTNPFTGGMFYIDGSGTYVHAGMINFMYLNCGLYILISAAIALRGRRSMPRAERMAIWCFLVIVTVAVGLQYMYPRYMLTGAAIALSIITMYLAIQKPDYMLDVMTGVFNRGAMLTFLQDRVEDGDRYQIIAIEMHNLNRINRIFGLAFGNAVLCQFAGALSQIEPESWAFRSIGNVFAVATRDVRAHERLFSGVQARLKAPFEVENVEIQLSSTVCAFPDTALVASAEEMVELMEVILPETAVGCVRRVDRAALHEFNRRMVVEAALIEAVEREALEVHYQPIYRSDDGACDSAEALVRFNHPVLGAVSPSEFIPIAEKSDLILHLDRLVMRSVCRFIRDGGAAVPDTVEINLSAVEFVSDQLQDRIMRILDEFGVEPKRILFEITETAATAEFETLSRNMAALCAKGFRFALDDYGTGYANIAQILRLPFYAVKIDRSMLSMDGQNPHGETVFDFTVKMFKTLGLKTVVEGVETEAQADMIRRRGVDSMQGYYYNPPMPEAEFARLMKAMAAKKVC